MDRVRILDWGKLDSIESYLRDEWHVDEGHVDAPSLQFHRTVSRDLRLMVLEKVYKMEQ